MQCEAHDLQVASEAHQFIFHKLINEVPKSFLLIEDFETNETIAAEAIRKGLPVRHSTV